MKQTIAFFIILFISCSSQVFENSKEVQTKGILFEDMNHYRYTITSKNFLVIDTQPKMDSIFKIIHQKNSGNRMAPIPTIIENEEATYLVFKPILKNTNDIEILKLSFEKGNLSIDVKPFDDPQLDKNNRIQPNVLIKILKKIKIKKMIINYKK